MVLPQKSLRVLHWNDLAEGRRSNLGGVSPLPDCFVVRLRQNGLAMTVSGQLLKTVGV